jgi:hypothetical protein
MIRLDTTTRMHEHDISGISSRVFAESYCGFAAFVQADCYTGVVHK